MLGKHPVFVRFEEAFRTPPKLKSTGKIPMYVRRRAARCVLFLVRVLWCSFVPCLLRHACMRGEGLLAPSSRS